MRSLEDRHKVAIVAMILLIMAAAILSVAGLTEAGVRMLVRASARSSAVLFFLAFAAPGAAAMPLGSTGGWVGRSYRPLFLSFGVSHFLHLAALACWAGFFPASFFARVQLTTVLLGALLYALIAFTCIRLMVHPAPASRWVRGVEGIGSVLLWLVFAIAYVARAMTSGLFAALAILALASLGFRFVPPLLTRRSSEAT